MARQLRCPRCNTALITEICKCDDGNVIVISCPHESCGIIGGMPVTKLDSIDNIEKPSEAEKS